MKALESPITTRESLKYGSRHSTETGETKILSVDLKDVLIEQGEVQRIWTRCISGESPWRELSNDIKIMEESISVEGIELNNGSSTKLKHAVFGVVPKKC